MTQSQTQDKKPEIKELPKVVEVPAIQIGDKEFINLATFRDNLAMLGNIQVRVTSTQKIVAFDAIGVGNSAAGNTAGNIVKKIQVFDKTGASIGYLAVYDAITQV